MEGAPHINEALQYLETFFYTGSEDLQLGQGMCLDQDYIGVNALTVADERRGKYVQLPSASNNRAFAGVTIAAYSGKTGGRAVTLAKPGSVAYAAISADTTGGATRLNASASVADPGRFWKQGYPGAGQILALQSSGTIVLETCETGAAVISADGVTLTDTTTPATFETNGVAAGDRVILLGIENDATDYGVDADGDAVAAREAVVSSVTSETVLVLTAAVTTLGGTMQCSFYIIRANPVALSYLYPGEQSGLVEAIMPGGAGHATNDTFTVMVGGMTYFLGGYTPNTSHHRAPLAQGFIGQRKGFRCLGTVTTYEIEVELDTDGLQQWPDTDGAEQAFHAATFDALNEELELYFAVDQRWHGVAVQGATIAAT